MTRLIFALIASLLLSFSAAAEERLAIAVETAKATIDQFLGQPVVNVRWSEEGRQAFSAFTRAHVGKRVDLMVGDEVVTSPVVQTPLDMAEIQITGLYTLADAEEIARRITGKKARIFVRLAEASE